ncbi:HERP2 protein, partial [Polypterus senegalus]
MDHNTVDSPVTLVIKAPNQKYDDQTINCFLNWTVEKLKSHLSKVYPSKPLSKDQRLVYSGKLLPDHLQLRDVLRKQDEYHMVHLVCASRTPPGSPKPGMSKSRSSPESLGTTTLDNSGTSANPETTSESAGSSMEGLRHRSQQLQVSPEQSRAPPYFMQGQAATASSRAPTSILPAPPVASQSVAPPPPPPPAQNEPPVLPNAAIPENRPVNQNIQMNAQGGPVINDDDLNRDWLDWMYTFSRAAILLSIVYFYSSFSRFIMVMGAMLLVYLHQAGWFPFRQDVQNPGGDLNAEEQGAEPQQDMQEMERLMDEGLEEDRGNDGLQEANAAQHPGLLALAWSFITTFFTSLIPEGPPNAAN